MSLKRRKYLKNIENTIEEMLVDSINIYNGTVDFVDEVKKEDFNFMSLPVSEGAMKASLLLNSHDTILSIHSQLVEGIEIMSEHMEKALEGGGGIRTRGIMPLFNRGNRLFRKNLQILDMMLAIDVEMRELLTSLNEAIDKIEQQLVTLQGDVA